ncbi:MAG: response regulator [Candidatus Thiodiazotropha sp.]
MKLFPEQSRPAAGDTAFTDRRYHTMAFAVSCVVVCCLAGEFLWQAPSADQLATLTLAAYYALIRLIQLITLGRSYHRPLLLHGPLLVFDQIYLAVMALSGLSPYVVVPLSGLLLYMTRTLGVHHLIIAAPAAFVSIFFSLTSFSTLQLAWHAAAAVALVVVVGASLNSTLPLLRNAIRKQGLPADDTIQDEVLQNPTLTPGQEDHFVTPVAEAAGLRILIISNNDERLALLSDHLNDWGYDYTISKNCVQAFRHMLSRSQVDRFVSYTTLVVDQHGLDLDPLSLAQLIQDEEKLEGLRLICYKSPSAIDYQSQQLIQAGYTTLLDSPLNKAQLFDALHGKQQQFPDSSNVVSLSEHRANRNSRAKKGIILLADAASSERTALSKMLIQAGYQVRMADDGDQTLDALDEQPIDLAVVNIKLSIMSGTQVLKLHRFTTPYKQWVPFVFLSDENNAETLRLCRSIGVQACLFKPVVAKDLLEMIPTLLTHHRSTARTAKFNRGPSAESNVTRFQHANLLDHMTLLRLERLDSGIAFINDLYKIFEAEGAFILRTLRQAVERRQFGQFIDQAQILLDSAGQLGAFALYDLSRQATKLRAQEFEYRGQEVFEELERTFNLTLQAYTHYLSQRAAALQRDRN